MAQFKPKDHNERIASAREAKQALLAKFKPKPAAPAENYVSREARLATERESVREARRLEKEAAKIAREAAAAANRERLLADEEAMLELKRQERRDRKAAMKMDAQSRRAARLALYAK